MDRQESHGTFFCRSFVSSGIRVCIFCLESKFVVYFPRIVAFYKLYNVLNSSVASRVTVCNCMYAIAKGCTYKCGINLLSFFRHLVDVVSQPEPVITFKERKGLCGYLKFIAVYICFAYLLGRRERMRCLCCIKCSMGYLCLRTICFKLETCGCKWIQCLGCLDVETENLLSLIACTYRSVSKLLHIEAVYFHLLRCKLRHGSFPTVFFHRIIVLKDDCKCTIVSRRSYDTGLLLRESLQQVCRLCFFSAVNLYELAVCFA